MTSITILNSIYLKSSYFGLLKFRDPMNRQIDINREIEIMIHNVDPRNPYIITCFDNFDYQNKKCIVTEYSEVNQIFGVTN